MKNKIIFIICLLLMPLFNQEVDISNIIVLGNSQISEEDIITFSGLSENSYVSGIDIQNSIKRLWLLNIFKDIQIDFEQNYTGNKLIINVIEYPSLNEIKFTGEYFKFNLFKFKKSKSKLKEISNLNPGDILSDQKIQEAMTLIKNDFIERNYHGVDIIYDISDSDDINKKNISFNITSGNKSKIRNIEIETNGAIIRSSNFFKNIFSSNDQIIKNKILKNLGEIKMWKWYLPWQGKYNQEKLNSMKSSLANYYQSKGYLDFNIDNYDIVIDKSKATLVINIVTGEKYNIDDINFDGNYIFNDSTIKSNILFSKGDEFNGNYFDLSNMNISILYRDKGYLFSEVIPTIIPISKNSLNINYIINEKSIVKVNKIIIKGNNKTQENVIRRDIDIFPNQIFSQSSIVESARKLFMLNYFENVIPDIKKINDNEVDIIFEVVEKSSGQLNFSAGYSQVYGFTGGGGFTFPNFLGKGQNISFNYQRGLSSSNQQSSFPLNNSQEVQSNQQFSFSYTEPRLFDTSNLVGISMNYTERGQSSMYSLPFDTKSYGSGIRLGRRFNWPDKFFKGSWRLQGSIRQYLADNESDLISYYSSSIEDYITYNGNKYIFSTSGVSIKQYISRDNRDHPEFPTQGSQFNWNFTLSGSFLGGDEDYYKNEIGFKWYNKIIDKLVLHQNFKFGVLNPIEVNTGRSVVPPSARFLMGGTGIPYGEMLRGYSENMIGPLGTSFPKGGNVMLKYSLELRYLISENPNMYVLVFVDAGNVWDNINIVDPFSLRRSMGFGGRVMMPMLGMLGYDIGYGFDSSVEEHLLGNNSAHGWEYHFIFGMPIK